MAERQLRLGRAMLAGQVSILVVSMKQAAAVAEQVPREVIHLEELAVLVGMDWHHLSADRL